MQPGFKAAFVAAALIALCWSALPVTAQAADEDVEKRLAALQKLVQQQQRELEQLRIQVSNGNVEVKGGDLSQRERELIAEVVRDELKKADVAMAKLPGWLDGLKFFGDLRIRYEGQFFDSNKSNKWDRNRGRFRLRFGFEKIIIPEELKVVLRLASGAEIADGDGAIKGDGDSTNQTFDDSFDEKTIGIDLAYAEYTPKWFKQAVKTGEPTILLGKFPNPLETTGLIWDSDINPEGVSEILVFKPKKDLEFFVIGGQWFAEEESSKVDTTLLVAQAGVRGKAKDMSYVLAGGFHHWINAHKASTFGTLAKGNSTTGGMLDFNDFELLDLYGEVAFKVPVGAKELPLKFYGHSVWNIGDPSASDASSGNGDETFGFEVGTVLGKAKKKGEWEVGYTYKYIEQNAVLGIFSDSDFGGTDRRGHIIKAKYALADNVYVGATLIITERINSQEDRSLLQTDLEIKF